MPRITEVNNTLQNALLEAIFENLDWSSSNNPDQPYPSKAFFHQLALDTSNNPKFLRNINDDIYFSLRFIGYLTTQRILIPNTGRVHLKIDDEYYIELIKTQLNREYLPLLFILQRNGSWLGDDEFSYSSNELSIILNAVWKEYLFVMFLNDNWEKYFPEKSET